MPHITVTYTKELADSGAFTWRDGFAEELQATVVELADGRPGGCRTRFVAPHDEWYIAGGTQETHQALHVEIALKAGRTPEVKARLSQAALDLVRKHLRPTPAYEVLLSVEIRDIDGDSYVSHTEPAGRP